MSWKNDPPASAVAAEVFPHHAPGVLSNGQQYVVSRSPYGRVELMQIEQGFLVAAERPAGGAELSQSDLPGEIRRHLTRMHLHPWKILPTHDALQAIRSLGTTVALERWSPLAVPLDPPATLIGEARLRFCVQLGGLIKARGPYGPLIEIVGPEGLGKRSVAAAAASGIGLSLAGELPLGRVFCPRVLATPVEMFLDTLSKADNVLTGDQVLVVTDTELLWGLARRIRRQLVAELQRLTNVILVGTAPAQNQNVITLACPGLEPDEARRLIADEFPQVSFSGAAFDLLCRPARKSPWGILPGRILYLVRLAVALLTDATPDARENPVLAPDEVTRAIQLASPAWADRAGQPFKS